MSDYSDDDFEMSGSGTAGAFKASIPTRPGQIQAREPKSPFRAGCKDKAPAGAFKLADDDDDEIGGYGGGPTSGGDEYEEDDFDEEEEEQFKKTAVEFAQKLSALRQSTNYQLNEGGEEPSQPNRGAEESKGNRSVNRQANKSGVSKALSPPMSSYKGSKLNNRNNAAQEVTEASLKSPTMLKTTMDKEASKKAKLRQAGNHSPSQMDNQSMMPSQMGVEKSNPFRFIEAALNEAKSKIEKMKNTPQILESLPDDEKKKKYLKAENKLLRENLKRMSDNVNVLIEKMNQESIKRKRGPGGAGGAGGPGGRAGGGRNVSHGGGNSMNGDDIGGSSMAIDESGRPVQGGVGAGLVPGSVQHRAAAGGHGNQSMYGQSTRTNKNLSPGARSNVRGGVSVAEREIQNTDKAIVNLMKEHNKLKRRLEMIQQPDFLLNLKRDLKTTQEEIKQQEKLKRQLKVDQLRREKKLDNMIEQSEPDVLKQVQDTTQRLAYLTEKLAKLEEENKKAEELRNQQIDQLQELRNRLTKLNTIAEHYGVSVEKSKENMAEHKKLTEQLEHLQKQKRILTQAIDTQTRKQEALTAEKKRDLEQLQMRKGEILAKYNERVVELREKGLQIRDLIERAKTEADDGLQDILEKWQQANERILEKYPEGSQMSFAQLEEVARNSIDIEAAAADDNESKRGTSKTRKPGVRAMQGGRDDEMQVYLSEIRQKQEQLITRLRQDTLHAKAEQRAYEEQAAITEKEESRQDVTSSMASSKGGGLKDKRNLIKPPTNKQTSAPITEEENDGQAAAAQQQQQNNDQADELAMLRAELEREKAEKVKLADQIASNQADEERRMKEQEVKEEQERKAAQQKRLQEEERKRREQAEAAKSQINEGGEQVMTPAPRAVVQAAPPKIVAQPVEPPKQQPEPVADLQPSISPEPLIKNLEVKQPEVVVKKSFGSKPNFGSKPKLGAASTAGKPPSNLSQSKAADTNLTFLERARQARQQPSTTSVDGGRNSPQVSQEELAGITRENDIARNKSVERIRGNEMRQSDKVYNPVDRMSTVDNQPPPSNAYQGAGGYQPSTIVGRVPSTLNAPAATAYASQEPVVQPRRRRGEETPQESALPSHDPAKREFNDPFANVGSLKPVGASQALGNKPLSYEQRLQNEAASKGSFLDMIGGGGSKPAGPSVINPSVQGSQQQPVLKMATPSVMASVTSSKQAPPSKSNMIANLDELEDLEL